MNNNYLFHVFGVVLFDHFSDGSRVLGGAPAGFEIAALMDKWGMGRKAVQTHPADYIRVLLLIHINA
jgi:fructokinase